jgi:hypothetical protein
MRLRSASFCLIAGVMLASCSSSEPPPASFDAIQFKDQRPIHLSVSAITVEVAFAPTFQPPEVEQNFPVPPQRAIENWVHDRLVMNSPDSPYHAKVIIKDASVREDRGNSGTTYTAHASLEVEILDANETPIRQATAESSLVDTVPRNASLDDQDVVWYNMTKKLVSSLGHDLERQIKNSFFPYAS